VWREKTTAAWGGGVEEYGIWG